MEALQFRSIQFRRIRMPATQQPNLGEIISALAAELDGPIAVDLFVDRVLARWPSSAKNPKANIRTKLRHEAADFDLLFTDRKRKWIAPLRVVMRGVRFRHLVSEQEAAMVALLLDEGETVFMPGYHWQAIERLEDLRLVDETGQAIRTKIVHRTVKFDSLFGPQQVEIAGLKIPDWWRNHRVHAGDSLLLTIENFAPPHWRVEHEPAALRNEDAIGRRNTEIVGILFDMLEAQVREGMRRAGCGPHRIYSVVRPGRLSGRSVVRCYRRRWAAECGRFVHSLWRGSQRNVG